MDSPIYKPKFSLENPAKNGDQGYTIPYWPPNISTHY